MNLDHDFVQVWKFSEDKKKANGTLFSPNSGEDQKKRSSTRTEHFSPKFPLRCTPIQTIRGNTAKLLGECIPHPPLVSAPLAENVEILSKKGKGHILLTLPIPLAHKIAKEMK